MSNTQAVENQKLQQDTTLIPRTTRKPRDYQQIPLYKDVNPLDWEDWHWQIKNRICTKDALSQVIKFTA